MIQRNDAGRTDPTFARNAGFNLAGHAVPVLVALGAIPVIVRGLGPERFGLLALAWTVVGYFSLFDLGFGRAATQRVAAARENGADSVGAVAGTALVAHGALGVVVGTLLWWTAAPLAALLVPGGGPLAVEGVRMLRLLGLGLPAVLLMNAHRAVLEGLSRFDLVNAVRAPFSAAVFLVPLAGVLLGWTLSAIVAGLVVSRYLAAALYRWLYVRVRGNVADGFTAGELRALARFGGWVAVSNVLIPLVVYMERFAVSAQGGPEALAYYAAPHELVAKLLIVPAAIAGVLYPLFSSLGVRGTRADLGRAAGGGVRVIAVLFAPVVILFVLFSEPLLDAWLGAEYARRGAVVLRLLATAAFLNALAYVPFTLIEGVGRPDVVAKYHLVELPIYAGVLWLLVGTWGIPGAALAWLLRMAWTTPLFFAITFSQAGITWGDVALQRGLRAVVAGLGGIAATHLWVLVARGTPPLWPGLLIPLLFAAAAWPWLLEESDRSRIRLWADRRGRPRHEEESLSNV